MQRVSQALFYLSLAFIVYMPLHVFISQSASLVTGGLEVWKASKDVLLVLLVPFMLYVSYRRGLFQNKSFKWLMILGGSYTLLHGLFVLFDQSDDTYSAIVGSVYNTRLLGYLLLGYLVGTAKNAEKYLKYLLTTVVIVASAVAVFGVAQYFLPSDLLANVGYTLERGVKPLFFIDDRPELPRVMSTIKDPNSLGAYLILPTLLVGYALVKKEVNEKLFMRPFRREALFMMLALMLSALFLSFSRGALIGLVLGIITLLCIATGKRAWAWVKKYWYLVLILVSIFVVSIVSLRNTEIVQDYVFHAAVSTDQQDPNEKRVTLVQGAIDDIVATPQGSGPGSAGLVAINNPQGGVLTENYYLQVAYEVGWLGAALFALILLTIGRLLQKICNKDMNGQKYVAAVLLASMSAYLFYSLLIHLWSNEAIALQWWLLMGVALGASLNKSQQTAANND
jgi:hypothetical protein